MTHDDEAAGSAAEGAPSVVMRALDDLEAALARPDASEAERTEALASARRAVAHLLGEVGRLERLNAASEREADALNAAMLALALEKRRAPAQADEASAVVEAEAPPAEAPRAAEPETAGEPSFFVTGGAEAFRHDLDAGPAELRFARRNPVADAPQVTLPGSTIEPGAQGCEIALGAGEGPASDDWRWTPERRAALAAVFDAMAAAAQSALSRNDAATPTGEAAEAWSALASYVAAVGRRTRSPAEDGVVVGPVALEGVGPRESLAVSETEAKTVRWTTQRTARFVVFVTRKGRLTLTVAARSLAAEQAVILTLDGATLIDEDLPADAAERASSFEVEADVDWGPHLIEVEGPAHIRERDGAFRTLHLLLEEFGVAWRPLDEEAESEAELFGWAPPLRALAG